jgi:hypothetical protein
MQQVDYRPVRFGARVAPTSRTRPGLREGRRTANRKQDIGDLRCECGQIACRAAVPLGAETYRGARDAFLVIPDHAGQDRVLAADDHFFLVEVRRGGETS